MYPKKIYLMDDDKFKKHLYWEIRALIACDSEYIVKYYGAFF